MSVQYRAVWSDTAQDDVAVHLEALKFRCAAWATETTEPVPLVEGQTEVTLTLERRRQIDYRTLTTDAGPQGFELRTRNQKEGESTVWTTIVRVVSDESAVHTLAENRMQSDDLSIRVAVGRPTVVHELLELAGKPVLGSSAILLGTVSIPANGVTVLNEILGTPGRALPVIVCWEPGGNHDGSWLSWATRIAARAEGVASVITLDRDAVTAFREELGDLAVWGGGIRVYAPTSVTRDSDGWRHRYYLRSRLEQATSATIDRIVYSVAQLSTRRRLPHAFNVFNVFTEQSALPLGPLDGVVSVEDLTAERERWESVLYLESLPGPQREAAP